MNRSSRPAVLILAALLLLAITAAPALAEVVLAQAPAASAEPQPEAAAPGAGDADAEEASLSQRLWIFVGVFHPMVVHFPIALLTLAAMVELARGMKLVSVSRDVTWVCLLLGAATAIVAAVLGWANATYMSETTTLATHRWIGISVTALAVVLAGVTTWQRYRMQLTPGRLYLAAILLLAGGVGFTGHQGGKLVYGEDYLDRAWQNMLDPAAARAEAKPTITMPDLDDPEATVDFDDHVQPILQARCIECHGPEKSEGDLRLDTEEHALEGGSGGPAYEAGDPEFSLMIELITSPFEDERMPPPDENSPLTDEELAVLERWIEQGAAWE